MLYVKAYGVQVVSLGMAIEPRPYGYPQKIPTMGRVKFRIYGMGTGLGNTHKFK